MSMNKTCPISNFRSEEDPDGIDFGRKRLVEALDACREITLDDALATVVRAIKDWAGTGGPQDDLTLLAIEISSSPDA